MAKGVHSDSNFQKNWKVGMVIDGRAKGQHFNSNILEDGEEIWSLQVKYNGKEGTL